MAVLASDLRRQLENVCVQARELAEAAACSALQKRAVDTAEPFSHFTAAEKELRVRLRARGRQVSDIRHANKTQTIDQLTQELAYEYWHRMLFARFLAENNLLMHPDGVAVSLEDCDQLAKSEAAPNGFVLAARYASRMLPQVFRTDDVLLEIEFAPEQRIALEKELSKLPRETFLADDSLGWVYQYWQTKKKDEINKSGDKIDGRTLPSVTQLFTEHYMVLFLLHNTIGAWWCARNGVKGQSGAAGVPVGMATVEMEYLRWRDDGTPAAGTFEGWPKSFKEFTLLDPCCGSGHFLVSAFNLLVPLRMHDEGLSAQGACEAVLQENLFGLELDPRCTQIAAFALAFAAWKFPDAHGQQLGYRPLPRLSIACSGQGVTGQREEWLALANGDNRLRFSLGSLYELFGQAPHLGSLLNPRSVEGAVGITGTFTELQPLLSKALAKNTGDADFAAIGVAAQGIARAAELLTGKYSLVVTNVPYLGRGKQNDVMKEYLNANYKDGKADLATAFLLRGLELCHPGGSIGLVTPQNWLFLPGYRQLREKSLQQDTWNIVARLGANAFQDMNFWASTTALVVMSNESPAPTHCFAIVDVSADKSQQKKSEMLRGLVPCESRLVAQASQLTNPDARIGLDAVEGRSLLSAYAEAPQGIKTGDDPRYRRNFWELPEHGNRWRPFQGSGENNAWISGLDSVIDWSAKGENFARLQGSTGWGKHGVVLKLMGYPQVSFHTGALFDSNVTVVVPRKQADLPALWCYCSSDEYAQQLKAAEQSAKINNATAVKVPFDLAHWSKIAAERWPNGLPKPETNDPTQWLFTGGIACGTFPLQIAVARLLGYQWPEQPHDVNDLAHQHGFVCVPGVRGEAPAAERLLELLKKPYARNWTDAVLQKLLLDSECKPGMSLDDWLRNSFFEQHCKRFQQRPFIWHIWDGRKDGFSCLVNYHTLNHKTLENLTYSYLGDWIKGQSADAKAGKIGADLRVAAAQALHEKLKLILAGEPPYDIFVRWKPLAEQAIGWNPDLNDGLRLNIRPFVQADILRKAPSIKWTKDRGEEQEQERDEFPWFWKGNGFVGDRVNDVHLSNAEKLAARKGAK
jgi:hypothetical protein